MATGRKAPPADDAKGSGSKKQDPTQDLAALAAEFAKQAGDVARQVQHAFRDAADSAQVEVEKFGARFAADHPDLYAELRKTMMQVERTAKAAAKEFGFAQDDRKRSSK